MSDVTRVVALPAEALAAVQAPGTASPGGPEGPRPTERAGAARRAEAGTDPFAALLQGFWASAQPVAPAQAPPVPALAAAGMPVAEGSLPQPAGPAAQPLPIQSRASAPAATGDDPAPGTILPLAGKGLPAASPGLPGLGMDAAAPDPLLPEPPPAGAGNVPERISLADLEAGRQAGRAGAAGRAEGPAVIPPGLAPDSDAPATADRGSDTGTLPLDTDAPELPLRTAPTGTPDFSRLVVELAASPARDVSTTNPGTPEFKLAGTALPASPASSTAGDPGLRAAVGSALQGFPALQPLGEPRAWTEGLGDRLLTLAGPGTHSARLKLHPESLGALDVEIRIDDGGAQVWFGTSHQQAREAIESSLPRLREMFADQGLTLIRAQVDSGAERRTPYPPAGQPDADLARGASAWSRRPDPVFSPVPAAGLGTSRLLDVWA